MADFKADKLNNTVRKISSMICQDAIMVSEKCNQTCDLVARLPKETLLQQNAG